MTKPRCATWGERDLNAVIHDARAQCPSGKVVLVGHSSGGHLAGLAPSLGQIDDLVLIASGTGDWRDYPASQWPRLLAVWWLAVPLLLRLFGYLPGWAGVAHDLPPGVAVQWRRWCLTHGYLFNDPALDLRGYHEFDAPLLALSMADDLGFAPPRTVHTLLAQFTHALKEHIELKPPFNWSFKARHSILWAPLNEWLNRTCGQ